MIFALFAMGKEREMSEEEHSPQSLQDVLLSYAWCVELTLEHLHQLHFVGRSKRTVEYALERLVDAGWIERHGRRGTSRMLHGEKASGLRLPMVWSLTPLSRSANESTSDSTAHTPA
jgi:hypothetical protein